MLVSGFMSAKVVGCYLNLRKVTVVFFAPMALFHVHPFSKVRALVVDRKTHYKEAFLNGQFINNYLEYFV
jgi:hypothetical protein